MSAVRNEPRPQGVRHLQALNLEGHSSPYAEQLRRGFPALKFMEPLEREFRSFHVAQNLRRTKFTGLIALVVVLAVVAIDLLLGRSTAGYIDLVRLAVLAPVLALLTIALALPALHRWYTELMATGVVVIGLTVTYIAHVAALAGASYVLIDLVVVILYGCLFVGLRFTVGVWLAALMTCAHIVVGASFGLPLLELLHTSVVLAGAAIIGGMSAYNLEHSLRTTFLETGLLNELAERDGLTGLYNRRVFDDRIERSWRHAGREGASMAIVLIDIDQFKGINDLYGHQVGDECLRKVAQCVARGAQRPLDLAARYGGEEFAVAFYSVPEDYVRATTEQIRRDVQALAITHAAAPDSRGVTVSVGVVLAAPNSQRSLAGLIRIADEALYQAKRDGRNRVVFRSAGDVAAETGKFRVITNEQR